MDRLCGKFDFDNFVIVAATGVADKLVVLWQNDMNLKVILKSSNMVCCMVLSCDGALG